MSELRHMARDFLILMERIAMTLDEFKAVVQANADATTAAATEMGNVSSELGALASQIATLIANNSAGTINVSDLAPIVAQIQDSTSRLTSAAAAMQTAADAARCFCWACWALMTSRR